MTDKELTSDDLSVNESHASPDEKSDIVVQDEDACTPLPEGSFRKSKKRLREVSTEPNTPKNEESVSAVSKAEPDLPSKKNRVKPALTEENGAVAEHPSPKTPPAASELPAAVIKSPAHDTKVRQIRNRVKNLSWKDGQRKLQDSATDDVGAQDEGPETVDPGSDGKGGEDDTSKSVSAKSDSDKEDVPDAVKKSPDNLAEVPESRTDVDTATDAASSSLKADAEACSGKRRRGDEDVNPREVKRVTPPPDNDKTTDKGTEDKSKLAAAPLSGFARYAGTSSPFSTANTSNVFGSTSTSKPALGSSTIPHSPTESIPTQSNTGAKPATSQLFGSSGFGKYAAGSSPFASAKPSGTSVFGSSMAASRSRSRSPSRSKSPGRHANVFETYSNRSGKFAATTSRPSKKQKKSEVSPVPDSGEGSSNASASGDEDGDGSPQRIKSFEEILSAKDQIVPATESGEMKTVFKEQEVITGEEDEYTEFQVRAKLFHLDSTSTWKERGVGNLKLNINEKTGKPRLVLRTDGVHRLVLNTYLFKGMGFSYGQDNRYVKFGVFNEIKPSFYTLRFSTAKHAEDLLAHVQAHTSDTDLTKKKDNV